ncbi:MAG: hypothetical protein IJ622_10605 [Bacteroidales bacterium]|nr:hypothetical protein [Bacteroidales bacterium]
MIEYAINEPNTLEVKEILSFLRETDGLVIPVMSTLVDLDEYAKKITSKAVIFTARDKGQLIGLTAIYFNRAPEYSYSTYTMVKREYQLVEMVGVEMSNMVRDYAKGNGSAGLRYEIRKSNKPLLRYHLRRGAKIVSESVYPGTDIVSLLMEITY